MSTNILNGMQIAMKRDIYVNVLERNLFKKKMKIEFFFFDFNFVFTKTKEKKN